MTKKKTNESSVTQSVMDQINSGDVKMKSRSHFVVLHIILIVSATLFSILAAILFSLFVHDVRVGQELRLDEFGSSGNEAFRNALPILMIFFAIIATGAVVLLAKHFEFSYRHKFNSLIAVVLLTVVGLSGLVTASGLNDELADTPPFKPLSTLQKLAEEQRVIGTIQEISEDTYEVERPDGEKVIIEIDDKTKYREEPMVGDDVVIFGEYTDKDKNYFKAYGLRTGEPRVRHPLQDHPRVKGERDRRMLERLIDIDEINRKLAE